MTQEVNLARILRVNIDLRSTTASHIRQVNEYLFNGILSGFTGRPWSGLRNQRKLAQQCQMAGPLYIKNTNFKIDSIF